MKELISMKREAFHIRQEKKKRDEILLSKRKFFLPSLENTQKFPDTLFNDIHRELTIDDELREDRIWTLLKDQKTIFEVIEVLKNSTFFNAKKNPALILHNLCWTSREESLKILIHKYKIHFVFLESLMDPQANDNIQEICLGGICNLLGFFINDIKQLTEQLLDSGIIKYFIQKGNALILDDNLNFLYNKIIQSIWSIYEAIQYFQIEKKLNSESLIEIFRVSLKSVKVSSKKIFSKMLNIACFSIQFINNLGEFLDEDWIESFENWFQEFIFDDDQPRITLCLQFLKEIHYHSQGSEMLKFFSNEKEEYLLFQAARTNSLLVLQILQRMLQTDAFEAFFRLRFGDIISIYKQVVTEEENNICTQIIKEMIETYPLEMIDLDLINLKELLQIFEQKYLDNQSWILVKINILNCLTNIITKDINLTISQNFQYQLEKDQISHYDKKLLESIDEFFCLIEDEQIAQV